MKILNFISGRNLGGSKQAFLDFSMMCHQAGFEVHSMIRTRAPIKPKLLKMPQAIASRVIEVNYFRLLIPPFKQWALKQLKQATQHLDADVIIVHKPIDVLFMRLIFPDKPIVSVIHSFTAKHVHHADLVLAVSESLKKYLQQQDVTTPVEVVNNSTEMVALAPATPRSIPVIGTMAVFRKTKRLDILLAVFRQLKQRNIPFKGIVAGAGILKPYLKFLIWRWNLQQQVELRPWVTDIEAFYNDVDIFAVTSKKETFNICIIEAMARKKAVMSTACGGPNEIIQHEVDGLLASVNDVSDIREKLTQLLQDHSLRERLSEAGYVKVQAKYQRPVVKDILVNQLNKLKNQGNE